MATRYIAVDSGKADTKVCTKSNNDGSVENRSFPTRVEEQYDRECLNTLTGVSNTGYIVEYDGRIFAVGDIANSDDSFTSNQNSKNDETHKIAILTAIAGSVNNDDDVVIAIGCPIEVFISQVNREKYLNGMLPPGRIDISINGIHKHFSIAKKAVLPESLGIVFANEKMFAGNYVGIIDIGGLNVNAAAVSNGKIATDACFTSKLGRRSIEKEIKEYAEQKYETTFSSAEIASFVDKGYVPDYQDAEAEDESRQFIRNIMSSHMDKIVKSCRNHGWNLRNMSLIFIGGTSEILKENIMMEFPQAVIVDNSAFANVRGFLIKLCKEVR